MPTFMVVMELSELASTTSTVLSAALAMYRVLPSGESAIPSGSRPTGNELTTVLVLVSMTETLSSPILPI
jgi:hypothetical protein